MSVMRTQQDIESDLIAVFEALTTRNAHDLNRGSFLRLIFQVFAAEHQETDYQISQMIFRSSLRFARGSDLDLLGEDEQLTRKSATGATGYMRLLKDDPAALNSPISAISSIVVSNGKVNYTNTVPCRIFAGSELWVVDDGTFGNPDIPFRALTTGTGSNSGAGTIDQIVTGPSGVEAVNNPASFDGGRLEETDEEFRDRISGERDRRAGGSRLALRTEALDIAEVYDAEVYEWTSIPTGSKYVKPSPGEVEVVVFPTFAQADQFTAGQRIEGYVDAYTLNPVNILQRVRNALEAVRAYPITVKIKNAYIVTVDVSITVTLYRTYKLTDTTTARLDLAQRIRSHILTLKLNEDLTLGHVYAIISETLPYKDATVSFTVNRNRSEFDTEITSSNVECELDEILKPAGSFNSFGAITIVYEGSE